jgi:heat shock protein HtpX
MLANGLCLVGVTATFSATLGWAALATVPLISGALMLRMNQQQRPPPRRGLMAKLLILETPKQRELLERAGNILHGLLRRLGIHPLLRPRLLISNELGVDNAAVRGRAIDSQTVIELGDGLHELPTSQLEGILAHELGHIVNRDFHRRAYLKFATFLTLFQMCMLFIHRLTDLWFSGIGALDYPAISATLLSLVFLRAVLRQQELRADGWAAWLVGADGLASYFEDLQGRSLPATNSRLAELYHSLLSSHPSHAHRIRRLRADGREMASKAAEEKAR